MPATESDRPFGHMVFFSLRDASTAAQQQLVDACHRYLSDHDGTRHFSVGTLATDMTRDVNDRDFHVALHLVFANRGAHDAYQAHPRHQEFIEQNKPNWAQVRVFDSNL